MINSTVKLGDVCEITMGQAPCGETYNTLGQGLPLIAGAGDFGDEDRPSAKRYTSDPTKICQAGDIVLSIRATIGTKVLSDGVYCLGRGVAGLRAKSKLNERYLWHWLGHAEPVLSSKGRGATFPQVSRKDIAELDISLPSLSEQGRIATILDSADVLHGKRKRTLELLDALRFSMFRHMFGGLEEGVNKYPTAKLGEVVRFYSGNSLPQGDVFHGQDGGFLLLKVSDLSLSGNEEFIRSASSWRSEPGSRAGTCETPAVVFPKRGGAIATNKKRKLIRGAVLDPNLMAVSPSPQHLLLDYLYVWFQLFPLESISSGSSVPQINKQDLAPLEICLPPIPVQSRFCEIYWAVSTAVTKSRKDKTTIGTLIASLQHRAFTGML